MFAAHKRGGGLTLRAIALPVLAVSLFSLGGCAREEVPPAPPGGVYRSASAGATFEQSVAISGQRGAYISSFRLGDVHRPARTPNTVFIAARKNGIVVSRDDGQNWRVISTPLANTLDVVSLPNDVLVASGTDAQGQGFVIRSLNGGESWDDVLTVPIPKEQDEGFQFLRGDDTTRASVVLSIAPDPHNPQRVYAGSNLGTIFIGEQSAKVWRSAYTVSESFISRLVPSPHTENEVMLVTNEGALVRVNVDTKSEELIEIPQNPNDPQRFGGGEKVVHTVSFIPQFPDALLAGVEDGIVITRDRGQTWLQLGVPVEPSLQFNSVIAAASPTNTDRLIVAINNVIYRSEDGGSSWSTLRVAPANHVITDLSINPENAARVLAVTRPLDSE